MKILAFVFAILFSLMAFAQSSPPTMYQDGKTMPAGPSLPIGARNAVGDALGELEMTNATGVNALYVTMAGGGVRICDGGAPPNCADVSQWVATKLVTLYSLAVSAGIYAYDPVGANMARIIAYTGGDAITATPMGLSEISFNHFYNGANFRRWLGAAMSSDAIAVTTEAPWVGSFMHIYDGTANTWERLDSFNVQFSGKLLDGMVVYSANTFWDATNGFFRDWVGDVINKDNISKASIMPYVANFNYGFDTVGDNWDRLTLHAAGDSLSATQMGLDTTAFVHFFNGTNEQRWTGSILSGETVANTTYAPHVKNMMYGYDSTSASWRWVNVLDAVTDNIAVSQNSLFTTSVMMGYDGATLDMMRIGAAGELQVTDVATRPGEDAANDWKKIKKQETAVLAPAKTTTAAIGAVATVVLASTEILNWPNYCIYIKNGDGADSFTDVDYQVSPDATLWIDLTEPAACDTLAPGVGCVFCESANAYRYVRVQVTGAAGPSISSVDCWITGSKG